MQNLFLCLLSFLIRSFLSLEKAIWIYIVNLPAISYGRWLRRDHANIILISQGHINAISREDEKEIRKLAKKHELRIHTLPLVQDKTNISTLFESISYHTGGNSFFIESTKSDLELYMDLLDSLREIRARSETNGPALVKKSLISWAF